MDILRRLLRTLKLLLELWRWLLMLGRRSLEWIRSLLGSGVRVGRERIGWGGILRVYEALLGEDMTGEGATERITLLVVHYCARRREWVAG